MADLYCLPASLAAGFGELLVVVEKLEEHDPGEHGQAVEVAVEALVLAHDVARGFDEAAQLLGGGLRGGGDGRAFTGHECWATRIYAEGVKHRSPGSRRFAAHPG